MAGIYLHIPFCKKRCIYCDFFSTTSSEKKAEYIKALCKELYYRKDYINNETIDTIYFGGGTPSQLSHDDFKQIFNTIYTYYIVNPKAEITLEANPDDLTDEYLDSITTLPFNRISIGIQTFNDETLTLLRRRHTSQQAIDTFSRCRNHGFHNISIDLIYGLPNETDESWEKDLDTAISLKPEHISAYHLIYEEGTALYKLREEKKVSEADEDLSNRLFEVLIKKLSEAGYIHYEISNFSLPDKHSRHNSGYWTGMKYIGCGPSAHSYNGISRQWNISSLDKYINGINNNKDISEKETLDLYTRYNDFVITSIRTIWGMPLDKLKSEFGTELYDYCLKMASPHIKRKKLQIENNNLRLTHEGIFISDGIMSDMLWVED